MGLGLAAGIPFGPVNAAVVDTSMRQCHRTALAVGVGGAFVDFIYSQLAVWGIGKFLKQYPDLTSLLIGGSGVVLVIFGLRTLFAPPLREEDRARRIENKAMWSAFFSGVLLTLANPAALVSWVVLAGALLSDLTHVEALLAGVGIFIGCTGWFAGIGWLARQGRLRFGARALWLTKSIGAGIVAYGVFLVGKAGLTVWTLHIR
jgi:threonine/homoserine/homoserine lactone efflux protein